LLVKEERWVLVQGTMLRSVRGRSIGGGRGGGGQVEEEEEGKE